MLIFNILDLFHNFLITNTKSFNNKYHWFKPSKIKVSTRETESFP